MRRPACSSGFTLIEVMIALAIFSIGILAVGSMQLWSTKNNTTGNVTTQATMLAREKIEFLKSLPLEEMGDEIDAVMVR